MRAASFGLTLLLMASVVVSAGTVQPVALGEPAAYKPRFTTTEGSQTAGSAFILAHKSRYAVVTAHHVFSPAGGFSRDYHWSEIADLVQSVELLDAAGEVAYSTTKTLPVPWAAGVEEWTAKFDIAMFELTERPAQFFTFATRAPKVGETVWLCALLQNRAADTVLQEAVVTDYDRNWLSYRFVDSELSLGGSSGAAVINAAGEVYGLNVSGGRDGEVLYGYANPWHSLGLMLKDAL